MATAKWVERAMNLAIKRVRLEQASIHLDPNKPFDDDTEQVREALRLYTETWIIPLLRAVRDGDSATAMQFTRGR